VVRPLFPGQEGRQQPGVAGSERPVLDLHAGSSGSPGDVPGLSQ
jgi:hypothetical protein